jgi:cysteine desulfurase/selenocysteine lyase
MSLDIASIKKDFPILSKSMRNDAKLIYLDSGATSQKPISVVKAEEDFYFRHNAAVHRGSHLLAEEANEAYENAREIIAEFIGAPGAEVIFTKSATESLNLLAYSISNTKDFLDSGDEILVSEMEHHANLIPWQEVAKRTGAKLRWIPVNEEGRLDLTNIESLINSKTKILSIAHQSNVLGTVNEIAPLVEKVHSVGGYVFLDGCQSVPHIATDVLKLGVDALAFSGHKMLGPTGIGILWAKLSLLDQLEPFLYGGSMIESVTMESATWAEVPRKFEAGVPNMAGAVGLGAAVNYLNKLGVSNIEEHLKSLTEYALPRLREISGLKLFGPTNTTNRGATFSFALEGIHPHDVGQVLDQYGIAVRTGHHCAWPLMKKFGLTGTTRASFYIYNDKSDVDALIDGINRAIKYFEGK